MVNPLKYLRNRKVGLALGSGGAKGLSHIAVLEFLESMNIPVDMIAGSSIGAVIGAVYLCGTLDRFKSDMLSFTKKEFLSFADITLPKSGLMKGKGFVRFMERYIPAGTTFDDLPKPLAIVATDYYAGKQLIFRKGNVLEALRGSVSIPGVLVPVAYGDTFLLDGGVTNPLPVDVVKDMGARLTVAVNLHPGLKHSRIKKIVKGGAESLGVNIFRDDIEYADDVFKPDAGKKSLKNGWFSSIEHWLKKGKGEEKGVCPSIFEVMFQSIDIMEYVNTTNNLYYHKPTVLIEPDLLNTGTLDFHRAKKIIMAGWAASDEKKFELIRKIKFWI